MTKNFDLNYQGFKLEFDPEQITREGKCKVTIKKTTESQAEFFIKDENSSLTFSGVIDGIFVHQEIRDFFKEQIEKLYADWLKNNS